MMNGDYAMDEQNDLNNVKEFLMGSPVYAMSLGNKELFHSNFWVWLMNHKHEYASVFFPDISVGEIEEITREEGHRDLTIWLKDQSVYVIENKLKSIPYEEQLENYTTALQKKNIKFKGGLLAGIESCGLPSKWAFKTYKDIGEELRKKAKQLDQPSPFEQNLIIQYANMIIKINDFISQKTQENKFVFGKLDEEKELHLDDIVKKIQAERFKKYLENNKSELEDVPGTKLEITTGFSYGEAMINVFYKLEAYNIGITIQGCQFRRVISKSGKAEEIFKFGKQKKYFEEDTQNLEKHGKVSMRKKYCKYDGSLEKGSTKNTHIYQWWSIGEEATFQDLWDKIKENMKVAKTCIRKQ
ncbi:MAG: hypothetical protein IKU26_08370 [Clostridia bacterium]|nr:hypothetical protein [Clostridia bacterium]